MSKISLLEFLRQGGALKTSAKVSSVLLPQLEVYGFVNSVGDDNLFASTWRGLQLDATKIRCDDGNIFGRFIRFL